MLNIFIYNIQHIIQTFIQHIIYNIKKETEPAVKVD